MPTIMKKKITRIILIAVAAMTMAAMPVKQTQAGWWSDVWNWLTDQCNTNGERAGLCKCGT